MTSQMGCVLGGQLRASYSDSIRLISEVVQEIFGARANPSTRWQPVKTAFSGIAAVSC
jgi:hypothetical protein